MKTKNFGKRYGGIIGLLAVIVVLVVLMIAGVLTPERISMLVRRLSFLGVLLAAMRLSVGEKKAAPILLCLALAVAGAVVTGLTALRTGLFGILGSGAYLMIPGLDAEGRCVSALLIGIIAAVCLMVTTLYSIGSQKRARRMKGRPLDQMVFSALLAVLMIVVCVGLFRYRGLPVAAVIAAVLTLVLLGLKKKCTGPAAYAVAGIASFLSGVLQAASFL